MTTMFTHNGSMFFLWIYSALQPFFFLSKLEIKLSTWCNSQLSKTRGHRTELTLSSVIDWWQHKQKLAWANLIVLALGTFHHPSRDYVWKDMQNSLEPTLLKKAIYFIGVVLKRSRFFRFQRRLSIGYAISRCLQNTKLAKYQSTELGGSVKTDNACW